MNEQWNKGKLVQFTSAGDFHYLYDEVEDKHALVFQDALDFAANAPDEAIHIGTIAGTNYWIIDDGKFQEILAKPRNALMLDKKFSAEERKIIAKVCGYIHFHHSFLRPFTTPIMSGKARTDEKKSLIFPRIDPAVIVLITNISNTKILVTMNARGAESFLYSPPAGFVEVGETLEDTVHREIAEELGIEVTQVQYQSSQSWPCPQSLMLGFKAVCETEPETFSFPDKEIVDARWLSRADVRAIRAGTRTDIIIPENTTVAGKMITNWLNESDA